MALGTAEGIQGRAPIHSKIIAGQADGTLIYIDPNGVIHVRHGTGPQAAKVSQGVRDAVSQVTRGLTSLVDLAGKFAEG